MTVLLLVRLVDAALIVGDEFWLLRFAGNSLVLTLIAMINNMAKAFIFWILFIPINNNFINLNIEMSHHLDYVNWIL